MWLLCTAALLLAQEHGTVDAAQFGRLLRAAHPQIKDIAFTYEGSLDAKESGADPILFQGRYAYRSDGATLVDFMLRHRGGVPTSRHIQALLRRTLTRRLLIADEGTDETTEMRGGAGSLNQPYSAERLLYWWYLATLDDPAFYDYKFEGWTKLDGHDCLVVRLSQIPATKAAALPADRQHLVRLWVDVERGMNPLRVDYIRGTEVFMRASDIRLASFQLPNVGELWLPAAGTMNVYQKTERAKTIIGKEPFYVESYTLVAGSITANQDLPDAYFDVKNHGALKANDPFALAMKAGKEARTKGPQARPFNVADAQAILERSVAEANRQSKQLDASAKASRARAWPGAGVLSAGLFGLGVVAITIAVILKRRA